MEYLLTHRTLGILESQNALRVSFYRPAKQPCAIAVPGKDDTYGQPKDGHTVSARDRNLRVPEITKICPL